MAVAKTGVATLASRSGAPILPIAITGTEALVHWRRIGGRKIRVELRVGSLLKVDAVSAPRCEQLGSITDELMLRIAGLLPASYRGVYGR
jgi:1-acyl-sn-glycerol-3-phosphate acyltransferase